VSAVLYSNGATLATFNRMGKLAGLGGKDITILRTMVTYDPNPYATAPNFETVNIDDPKYEESWSDTITMYHNPNAKYPVDTNSFPDITHMFLNKDKNILYGHIPPYSVLSSFSITILSEKFK
jgi:hypothetical protein